MKSRLRGAVGTAIFSLLFSSGLYAAQINALAKVSVFGYALELEINDFANASAVDLVHPTFGTLPLIFDSGEGNWDVEAEGLELSDVNSFFDNTFNLDITHTGGASLYTADRLGPPGAGAFPDPASSLTVSASTNPLRPTANWTGGDASANSMIITYEKGDDEFTDGFEPPEVDGTRTIGQDLAPGTYDVTLGFYSFLDPFGLSLTSGDDVLGVTAIDPAMVGETFASATVVPLPAAAWLFGSALFGLIGIARRKTT